MSTNAHVHPAFASILSSIAPLAEHGPLEPSPAPAAESYTAMVDRLCEARSAVTTLTLEETAVLLHKYPEALLEPLVDAAPRLTELLTDPCASTVCIEARIGRLLIDLARGYAIPMLRQDIHARRETHRRLNAIEDLGSHFPKTDEAQELMTELGMGSAFR